MNLVEKLLSKDSKKAEEKAIGVFQSHKLARVLEEDKPVEVTLQEIPIRRYKDLQARCIDKKGNPDISKYFDTNALIAIEGMIEPSLKDKKLQKHFNCATPLDLAIKLFGLEIDDISDKIGELCGLRINKGEVEEEIKN